MIANMNEGREQWTLKMIGKAVVKPIDREYRVKCKQDGKGRKGGFYGY